MRRTDRHVEDVIRARQQRALGLTAPAQPGLAEKLPEPSRQAYVATPRPVEREVPEAFTTAATQPATTTGYAAATTQPAEPTDERFTLTAALEYAQRHRRAYQTAKETLYVVALDLTLERHLWTPIFASELRTVYGNYGEAQDFDQAMRFVADLSVSQRLPYGGEFTASTIATLIRDVGNSITGTEEGQVALGLNIPLLRGAGHVAREDLIQLERSLTYAVRTFERFRRQQLVLVSREYFDLLRTKQQVIDSAASYERAQDDLARAEAKERLGTGTPLDTQRAEQRLLSAENALQRARENFRSQADQFKLQIGMPIDEPLWMDDLEDIETIETRIARGEYPLLRRPVAVANEDQAIDVAVERRFDLRTQRDLIDDARRGVSIARNALLPDLNWNSSLTFDTQDDHFNVMAHHFEQANWLTELTLELPLERTAERNALRRALIDVRRAQRELIDQTESVRAEVRRIINNIRLQERLVEIQQRSVEVAERQREFAQIQFEEGLIDNRDKVEAEQNLLDAQNALNQAKTDRWTLLLQFRLATETLHVDETGVQEADADLP